MTNMGTFTEQQKISTYWYNKASDLRASAAAIHQAIHHDVDFPKDQYGLSDGFRMDVACPLVYRMLWGMALEALIKAVILENGDEIRKSHNLNQLARDARITYTTEQQKPLQILSEAIFWDGRYPVPKEEKHWDELADLKWETLYDRKPLSESSTLVVYSPNDKLNWESLQELWIPPMTELCRIASWLQH